MMAMMNGMRKSGVLDTDAGDCVNFDDGDDEGGEDVSGKNELGNSE